MTVVVTGFTAARSQEIEDSAIISGDINGAGDLILTTRGGSTINAGSVIGPANNGLIICTSSTRPSSPFQGMAIYETNTKNIYVWNGSAWKFWFSLVTGEDRVLPFTQAATGGPIGGSGVNLATINIAARAFPYKLECAAFWTGYNTDMPSWFVFNIKVDGVVKGEIMDSFNAQLEEVHTFSIPTTTIVTIPAGNACEITFDAVRITDPNGDGGSSGTLVQQRPGVLRASMFIIN